MLTVHLGRLGVSALEFGSLVCVFFSVSRPDKNVIRIDEMMIFKGSTIQVPDHSFMIKLLSYIFTESKKILIKLLSSQNLMSLILVHAI